MKPNGNDLFILLGLALILVGGIPLSWPVTALAVGVYFVAIGTIGASREQRPKANRRLRKVS